LATGISKLPLINSEVTFGDKVPDFLLKKLHEFNENVKKIIRNNFEKYLGKKII
jgi:hypothetical protein